MNELWRYSLAYIVVWGTYLFQFKFLLDKPSSNQNSLCVWIKYWLFIEFRELILGYELKLGLDSPLHELKSFYGLSRVPPLIVSNIYVRIRNIIWKYINHESKLLLDLTNSYEYSWCLDIYEICCVPSSLAFILFISSHFAYLY